MTTLLSGMVASGATFTMPAAPDVLPITSLHRNHDGYVAFTRNSPTDGKWQELCSVKASELDKLFPQFIAPMVDKDAYFSINGFFRPGYGASKHIPQLPAALRRGNALRWLTAAYADLDFHKLGVSVGQAFGAIVDMIERGIIPPVSMIFNSGRGLWLFWMLVDDTDGGPVRAWSESVATYQRIQRAAGRQLLALNADPQARDVSRVAKVPGTLSRVASKERGVNVRVAYWIPAGPDGRGFSYRLNELAVKFNVAPAKFPSAVQRVCNPQLSERGRRGWKMLNAGRLDSLQKLISMRHQIPEGMRNRTALLLSFFMHRCKLDPGLIDDQVQKFGQHHCSPPLTDAEISDAIKSGSGKGLSKFTDATISEWLDINRDDEAEMTGWPLRSTINRQQLDARQTRDQARTTRRELVGSIIRQCRAGSGGKFPTIDEIKDALAEQAGIEASRRTINDDVCFLEQGGVKANPRRRKRGNRHQLGLLGEAAA